MRDSNEGSRPALGSSLAFVKELPAELNFRWLARWPMRSLALTDTNRLLNFHLLGSSVTFSDDILSLLRSIISDITKVLPLSTHNISVSVVLFDLQDLAATHLHRDLLGIHPGTT